MVSVEKLTKCFGNTAAVNDISFRVEQGERLILLGTSGCGKTTTLRMINRLIEPDSGTVTVNGKDITSVPPEQLRRGIGYVLQNHGLFPHYTVAENIAIVPKLLHWEEDKIRQRTADLVEQLHLPADILHTYPDKLSGGQQQRVGLARALAADPPVLLMDEPFGSLDPVTRSHVRKEFMGLEQLASKTVLMVTHDIQEAFTLGDRICLMDKGRIMQIGTPAELLRSPANDFVNTFLEDQRLLAEFALSVKNN